MAYGQQSRPHAHGSLAVEEQPVQKKEDSHPAVGKKRRQKLPIDPTMYAQIGFLDDAQDRADYLDYYHAICGSGRTRHLGSLDWLAHSKEMGEYAERRRRREERQREEEEHHRRQEERRRRHEMSRRIAEHDAAELKKYQERQRALAAQQSGTSQSRDRQAREQSRNGRKWWIFGRKKRNAP